MCKLRLRALQAESRVLGAQAPEVHRMTLPFMSLPSQTSVYELLRDDIPISALPTRRQLCVTFFLNNNVPGHFLTEKQQVSTVFDGV